jgi:hypothetical protein
MFFLLSPFQVEAEWIQLRPLHIRGFVCAEDQASEDIFGLVLQPLAVDMIRGMKRAVAWLPSQHKMRRN